MVRLRLLGVRFYYWRWRWKLGLSHCVQPHRRSHTTIKSNHILTSYNHGNNLWITTSRAHYRHSVVVRPGISHHSVIFISEIVFDCLRFIFESMEGANTSKPLGWSIWAVFENSMRSIHSAEAKLDRNFEYSAVRLSSLRGDVTKFEWVWMGRMF